MIKKLNNKKKKLKSIKQKTKEQKKLLKNVSSLSHKINTNKQINKAPKKYKNNVNNTHITDNNDNVDVIDTDDDNVDVIDNTDDDDNVNDNVDDDVDDVNDDMDDDNENKNLNNVQKYLSPIKKQKKKKLNTDKIDILKDSVKFTGGNKYNCENINKMENDLPKNNLFGISLSFIPILGDFNRYFINKSYKNYTSVYKNSYFIQDMLLFIGGHILCVLEIFTIVFFLIKYYKNKQIENIEIYIIIGVITLRIIYSIILYYTIINKKKYDNKKENIDKIRKYLKCLNKYLISSNNNLSKNELIHIREQLYFMSNYYKEIINKTYGVISNMIYVIIMFLILILPKILFVIMYFMNNMSFLEVCVLSTLILFLLFPYLRILISYIDVEEKYPILWFISHIIEKCVIIMLVYIIVLSILNKEITYNNILNDLKFHFNKILNIKKSNISQSNISLNIQKGGDILKNFNILFNK